MRQILLTLFDLGVLGGCGLVLHHVWVRCDWPFAVVITLMVLYVATRTVLERLEAWHKSSVYGE